MKENISNQAAGSQISFVFLVVPITCLVPCSEDTKTYMEGLAHVGVPLRASQMVCCVGIVNHEDSAESFQGPGCCT